MIITEDSSTNINSISLITLPFGIYTEIQKCLYPYDYRNFLNVSNSPHFREIKKLTIILHLKEEYSVFYCTNDLFRERVLNVITDKSKQLMLLLNNREIPKSFFQLFHDLRQLKCGSVDGNNDILEISQFYNIFRLDLRFLNKLQNCTGLKNVTEIELFLCSSLNDISALALVSGLRNVRIECCGLITNIDSLWNIPIVHIYKCSNILSISKLGGPLQREVYFHDLPKVTDISCFANLQIFSISYCPLITDISMLGNIPKLSMSCLDRVTTLNGLNNVRIMMMHSMVTDYSPLKDLTNLTLTYCNRISDFSCFVSLTFLSVAYCNGVKSLESLSSLLRLKKVIMRGLPELHEIGNIQNAKTSITFIEISECPIQSVEGLGFVRTLKLEYCKELTTLKGLIPSFNYNVEIIRCHEIIDFSSLSRCCILRINDCLKFHSLNGINNLLYGYLTKLNVRFLSFAELTDIKQIVISQCPLLYEMKGLKNVELLIIDDGRKCWKFMN
jgi:hypothetical protein